jgi:hypothetical protein
MGGETGPIHVAAGKKRQQDRGETFNAPARAEHRDGIERWQIHWSKANNRVVIGKRLLSDADNRKSV